MAVQFHAELFCSCTTVLYNSLLDQIPLSLSSHSVRVGVNRGAVSLDSEAVHAVPDDIHSPYSFVICYFMALL